MQEKVIFPPIGFQYIIFVIMAHTKHFIYVYSVVEQKVAPGSEVIDTESGKKAGKVTTALGCRGMGVLRLEQAFKGSGTLTIEGQEGDVRVEAIRPQWWPAEWFQEYQQNTAAA